MRDLPEVSGRKEGNLCMYVFDSICSCPAIETGSSFECVQFTGNCLYLKGHSNLIVKNHICDSSFG